MRDLVLRETNTNTSSSRTADVQQTVARLKRSTLSSLHIIIYSEVCSGFLHCIRDETETRAPVAVCGEHRGMVVLESNRPQFKECSYILRQPLSKMLLLRSTLLDCLHRI